MKFGGFFKAHSLKITPCSWNKDKLKIAWMFQIYFVSITLEGHNFKIQFSCFNRSYVLHLAGHLRIAISADTIFVSYLRITLGPEHNANRGKNDILYRNR